MKRNPYFLVLLALSVMQVSVLHKMAFAQQIPILEIKDSQISATSTSEEPSVTQFNIFGRHGPLDAESSENQPRILSRPANYSIDETASYHKHSSVSSSSDSEEVSNPSAAASSLLPTNFSSPYTANKPYKKPKVVLTLSLRSKESGDPNNRNNVKKPKSSPFIFGNNVIKFDTRTNRLIIPTTTDTLEVLETDDDLSAEGEASDSEEFGGSTVISVITEGPLLEVQNHTLTALKILEKLRGLTNTKLRVSPRTTQKPKVPPQKEPWYGFKKYETLHPRLSALRGGSNGRRDEQAQASTQVASTSVADDTIVEYTTLTSKVGGHIKQNVSKFQIDSSNTTPQVTSSGPSTPYYSSTPPVVLKVGKLAVNTRYQNSSTDTTKSPPIRPSVKYPTITDSITSSSEIDSSTVNSQEQIKTGETRVAVTADQIGGNRPTHQPFHFGPTTQPPTTTTKANRNRNKNVFHPIGKSPHNHAYSPTQDPVSDIHNEDLSVEDFQDFRLANAVFGSKVGANVPTLAPQASAPRPPPVSPGLGGRYNNEVDSSEERNEYDDYQPSLPVRLLQESVKKRPQVIIRTTPPTTTTTTTTTTTKRPVYIPERRRPGSNIGVSRAPQLQASSGVKDSQIPIQNDNNLPFYKEPGGVFKEHQSNNHNSFSSGLEDDDNSNFINHDHDTFNENRPKVKYAPKAPSAHSEPQTVYANHINGNDNRHIHNNNRHYNPPAQQQPQQQIHHHHNPQPQYVPVTQAPIFLHQHHQQPLMHHQQFAVIPSQAPQVVVSPLHQRPQQQPIYYHAQQPALVATVVPTQQIYQQPAPGAGFVPILHPQQQAYAAAPIQPQYQNPYQNQYNQNQNNQRERDADFPHRNDPNSDTFFGDPIPDTDHTPKSDKKSSRGGSNNANRRNNKKPQHIDHHGNEDRSYQNQRGQYPPPPAPPVQQQRRYPSPQQNPLRGREPNENSRERFNNNRNDDDLRNNNPDYPDGRNLERPRNSGYNNNRNGKDSGRRRGDSENYDPEAEAGIKEKDDDDFVEPNFDNIRPVFDDAPGPNIDNPRARDRNGDRNRERNRDRNENGRDFPANDKPFRPSPQDFGPIRPSAEDFAGPQFDHPNLQYPQQGRDTQRRQNFDDGPEYDPKGFGVGHGPPPSNNVQLDPIYTRTIKQYDEENRKNKKPQREEEDPPLRHNSQRPSGQRRERYEDDEEENRGRKNDDDEEEDDNKRRPPPRRHEDDEDEDNRRKPPPRRHEDDEDEDNRRKPPPRRHEDDEDEDDRRKLPPRRHEDDEDEDNRRKPPPRRHDDDEEEEEEDDRRRPSPRRGNDDEEEEEEEEEAPQGRPSRGDDKEEEEEEEEEEEPEESQKPPRNRQRSPGKNKPPKKRPKPPPNEKAGDLEDDIRQINQEFAGGGIAYGQSKQPVVLKTPSGVIISPSVGASVNRPTFNLNSQQQRQGLLKSPSSPTETKQALPNANVGTPDLKNITSFNVHLLQNQSISTNTDESSSKVIVDL